MISLAAVDGYYDVFEAAAVIGVKAPMIRHLARTGQVKGQVVAGRTWVLEKQSVEDYARRRQAGEIKRGPNPKPKPVKRKRGPAPNRPQSETS